MNTRNRHQVVIVGGGFAGLFAAHSLRRAQAEVTLIDRRNFHLFQPLLYQVATGGLSPADIASPLRSVLRRQRNTRVLQGEVTGIDTKNREVLLGDEGIAYDSLVVATGASHQYFGNDHWEPLAPGLKSIEDALDIRRRIFSSFELAERESDPEHREQLLNFVVVGAGPTGVELAGALGELAHHTLPHDFRSIDTREANVFLIQGEDRVLPSYPPDLSQKALASLERLGVTVRTGVMVTEVGDSYVLLRDGDETERIPTSTVLWAAGVQASPLGKHLAELTGAELDRQGRVIVEPDLSLPGAPEIFVLGDMAHVRGDDGQPLPGVAPVAIQQGQYVSRLIRKRLKNKSLPAFHYQNRGNMAVIGRSAAVAEVGNFKFGGFFAWLLWLFIHLIFLVEFQNRLLVLMQWGWNYFTRNRSARLITPAEPLIVAKDQSVS